MEIPQGLFSGRGGDGNVDGLNGSVTNVTARQIAAIAAAMGPGGLFAPATKISGIKASVIGFEQTAIGTLGTFDSTLPGAPNPGLSKPIDGFIFGKEITGVATMPPISFVFTS